MTMSELTGDLRLLIEEIIDKYLKDPNAQTDTKETLVEMGIQPNLETTLSLITGQILGVSMGMWLVKRLRDGKSINPPDEDDSNIFAREAVELITRRAMELRQHFVKEEYM